MLRRKREHEHYREVVLEIVQSYNHRSHDDAANIVANFEKKTMEVLEEQNVILNDQVNALVDENEKLSTMVIKLREQLDKKENK